MMTQHAVQHQAPEQFPRGGILEQAIGRVKFRRMVEILVEIGHMGGDDALGGTIHPIVAVTIMIVVIGHPLAGQDVEILHQFEGEPAPGLTILLRRHFGRTCKRGRAAAAWAAQ